MPDNERPPPIAQPRAPEDPVDQLLDILEKWSAARGLAVDPEPTLISLCEIVERETELYLKMDPDPFDDRHPFRINPNSPFGALLKALFRNDEFMDKLVNFYISARENPKLNELACRLLYDILPGLEGSIVFQETEGIVSKLYKWAEEAENPLKSYAIGLLAAAMSVQDIAVNWREKNARLMPLLMNELNELSNLPVEVPPELKKFAVERPFASLNGSSDSKTASEGADRDTQLDSSNVHSTNNNNTSDNETQVPNSQKRKKCFPRPSSKRIMLNPSRSPVRVAPLGELSNSSWAEKEFLTIGHYQIYPLSTNMRQRFILQYLTPLGDYQEFLPLVLEKNILKLILHYINLKENRDVRLAFEALRYLASLLCHKKFTMEFLKADGVSRLLQVHRPSVAATGVSICLYYLGYSEDAMEKLCQLPSDVLTELIKYSLWLLERSHESSRCHAIMFLGMALTYPKFLEYFDREEGLRWIMNVVSTLEIITNPDIYYALADAEHEDKKFTCMQTARHVCFTLKKYFEAQLMLKADQLRLTNSLRNEEHSISSSSKQLRWKQEEIEEALDFVLVNLPSRLKWPAVDNFVKLGGVQLMLKLLLIALDETSHVGGKVEMIRSALEVLSVCFLVPKTQLLLTESVEHPNPELDIERDRPQETIGMSIILSNVDNDAGLPGEVADLQKASLRIIHNCVGGPRRHEKLHLNNVASTSSETGSTKKSAKSGEGDVLHRMWKCLRSHNGIMVLLGRLSVKVPITEADAIRALACKALCGLARCSTVKQIISKLPLFTRGELEVLTREPILYDSSAYHVRFCQYANTLAQLVTGNPLPRNRKNDLRQIRPRNEVSSVAPLTDIKYKPSDLLVLMYEHLLGAGLTESAQALLKEAKLQDVLNGKRNHWRRMAIREDPRKALPSSTTSTQVQSSPITPQSKTIPLIRSRDLTATPVSTVNRRQLKTLSFIEKPDQRDVLSPVVRKNAYNANVLSLDTIVREYLGQQHSCCNVPVATCPPFDLMAPHRCEEPILKSFAPQNLMSRILRRQVDFPWGGRYGAKQTRKFVYSKFKPVRTFRESDLPGKFTCCAFSSCDEMLFAGTLDGELKVFNLLTGADEATYNCHDTELTHCQPSKEGTLILTSSFFRQPTSVLWTFTDLFQQKMTFAEDTYVEFGKLSDERILGTQYGTARLYDSTTGRKIATFFDQKLANQYIKNRATLNSTDELVLNDGVLWDVRRALPVHKFDKFNPYLNGVFTPNGLEVISNTEVWDLRTYKLLHTIPALNQCQVLFNSRGDVIYGAMVQCEDMDQERDEQLQSMYGHSFKTIDATDYSNIATIDIKRSIYDIKTDRRDVYLAIVENAGERSSTGSESIVKLYEVGRQKLEGDLDDNEQEDSEDVEGDSDGDSDDDSGDSNSSTEMLDDTLDGDSSNDLGSLTPPMSDNGDDGDGDEDDDDDDVDDNEDDDDMLSSPTSPTYPWFRGSNARNNSDIEDDGSLFQVNRASTGGGGANSASGSGGTSNAAGGSGSTQK